MAEIIEVEGVRYKTCTKCGELLPVDQFAKKTNSKDGYQSWCRKCTADTHKARRERIPEEKRIVRVFAPSAPIMPEELSEKPVGKCNPLELMTALKLWGYDGTLEFKKTIRLSDI